MNPVSSRRMLQALSWAPCYIVLRDTVGSFSIIGQRDAPLHPALPAGTSVWVTRLRGGSMPNRGDVVAMTNPCNPRERLYLRVMALSGDYVRLRSERSGSRLIVVPQGAVWVEADELCGIDCVVADSNSFGPVSSSLIYGRVSYAFGKQVGLCAVNCHPPSSSKFVVPVRGYS